MGVDWVRKAEERFKHQLQESAHKRLKPMPLFDVAKEEETVTYACHSLHEDETLPLGTRLTIFHRSDRAHVAVMQLSKAVAEVRGEAVRDLKNLFGGHPELHNMLPVTIVSVGHPTEPFYVQPVTAVRKRTKVM